MRDAINTFKISCLKTGLSARVHSCAHTQSTISSRSLLPKMKRLDWLSLHTIKLNAKVFVFVIRRAHLSLSLSLFSSTQLPFLCLCLYFWNELTLIKLPFALPILHSRKFEVLAKRGYQKSKNTHHQNDTSQFVWTSQKLAVSIITEKNWQKKTRDRDIETTKRKKIFGQICRKKSMEEGTMNKYSNMFLLYLYHKTYSLLLLFFNKQTKKSCSKNQHLCSV